jgi:hypothetical protein
MRPIVQNAARRRMMGKDRRQQVTGGASHVDNRVENRKIIRRGNGRRLLAMDADHGVAEQ